MRKHVGLLAVFCCLLWTAVPVSQLPAQTKGKATTPTVTTVKPSFVPPSELLNAIGAYPLDGREVYGLRPVGASDDVIIHNNAAANLLVLSGAPEDVEVVQQLIRDVDVAPRQIAIEAKIIEIDHSKARDLGIDWDDLVRSSNTRFTYNRSDRSERQSSHQESADPYVSRWNHLKSDRVTDDVTFQATVNLSNVLHLLDETGAGSVRNTPRILTLNNRRATILDGQRVTYVTRYSSYSNLYQTDSMDAGLTLSVLPSLGESGYLTLQVSAELTQLLGGDISGSPVKGGQMVNNTIIVRDGESVLLGGFQRVSEQTRKRRFPILGHVLPFLFSRDIKSASTIDSYIVMTTHVVDLDVALDDATREAIDGR